MCFRGGRVRASSQCVVLLWSLALQDTLMATRTAAFPTFTANWLGRWSYIMQVGPSP